MKSVAQRSFDSFVKCTSLRSVALTVLRSAPYSSSLADDLREVARQILRKVHVAFVSITQHFDTSTSMGRLVLHILLSFAQLRVGVDPESGTLRVTFHEPAPPPNPQPIAEAAP